MHFEDPWLTEKAVREQIKKVTLKENEIQQALLKLQNDIMNHEASMMQSLKTELANVIMSMQQHHGRLQVCDCVHLSMRVLCYILLTDT